MNLYYVVTWTVGTDTTKYNQGFDTLESAKEYADSIRADESRWTKEKLDVHVVVAQFKFDSIVDAFHC